MLRVVRDSKENRVSLFVISRELENSLLTCIHPLRFEDKHHMNGIGKKILNFIKHFSEPEEDLDNQVILSIVEDVWSAKGKRQVVFVSHNANIVVNGDADLVIVCDYRTAGDHSGGRIKCQGAIDIEEIRNEITSIMEGGKEAFKLRNQKYGF